MEPEIVTLNVRSLKFQSLEGIQALWNFTLTEKEIADLELFQSLEGIQALWNVRGELDTSQENIVSIPGRDSGSLERLTAGYEREIRLFQSLEGIQALWNIRILL